MAGYLKLPVPPYQDPNYWEGVYRSLGPSDVFEWGNISGVDLLTQSYRSVAYEHPVQLHTSMTKSGRNSTTELYRISKDTVSTSLGELLGVHPNGNEDEPILVLGCGNSEFGEQLVENAWKGPIVQVDCSARVTESLSIRCAKHLQSGDMLVLQDDATMLSALDNGTIASAFDKGLVDALFCTEDYQQIFEVFKSVHRVLQPGSIFCCLSFSRPEFILQRLLLPPDHAVNIRHAQQALKMWSHVDIRLLNNIYCYRFTKPHVTVTKRPIRHNSRARN